MPNVLLWCDQCSLLECPDSESKDLLVEFTCGVDRGAAVWAKGLQSAVATFSDFEIGLGFALEQLEVFFGNRDHHSKGCPR